MVDPAAALQVAEAMQPEAAVPAPAAAERPYFGPGPEPVRPPERGARLGAPAAAAVLARRPRRGTRGRDRDRPPLTAPPGPAQ